MKDEITPTLTRAIVGMCLIICAYVIALAAIWYKFGAMGAVVYNTVAILLTWGIRLITSDGAEKKHEKDSDTL